MSMDTMAELRPGRAPATLAGVPVPNKRLKDDLADDLDHHAEINWPQLGEVVVRWRGGYGYVIGHLDTGDEDTEDTDQPGIALCRLGYLSAADDWAFALYDPATDTYQDTILPNGTFTGTPQEALDCACQIHLADTPNGTTQP
jgi:hypothetical protein